MPRSDRFVFVAYQLIIRRRRALGVITLFAVVIGVLCRSEIAPQADVQLGWRLAHVGAQASLGWALALAVILIVLRVREDPIALERVDR